MDGDSKILTASNYDEVSRTAVSRAHDACDNRLQIAVMRADRAALVALVQKLADRVLHGISMHDGSCRECGHQLAAETAPHDADCDVGKLLARARTVTNV